MKYLECNICEKILGIMVNDQAFDDEVMGGIHYYCQKCYNEEVLR